MTAQSNCGRRAARTSRWSSRRAAKSCRWRCWRTGGWPAAVTTARSGSGGGPTQAIRWFSSRIAPRAGPWRRWRKGVWPSPASRWSFTHGGRVLSLAAFSDGRLASAGDDGKIELWPRNGAGQPVVLPHDSDVKSLAVLAEGRLASGGEDGNIKLWLVDEQKLIAALCLRAGRNLTKDEWARYVGPDTPWQPSCRDRPSNWRTPNS